MGLAIQAPRREFSPFCAQLVQSLLYTHQRGTMTRDEYRAYLKSPYWRAFAKERKEKRKYTCQRCGEKKKEWELDCHHLTYERMPRKEWASDVLILCRECHITEHTGTTLMQRIDEETRKYFE